VYIRCFIIHENLLGESLIAIIIHNLIWSVRDCADAHAVLNCGLIKNKVYENYIFVYIIFSAAQNFSWKPEGKSLYRFNELNLEKKKSRKLEENEEQIVGEKEKRMMFL